LSPEPTSQKKLGTALFYGIVALLAYLVYLVFEPFLGAFAWAAVMVVVSYPAYAWLSRRWGSTIAAIATTAGMILILVVPTLLLMTAFVRQAVNAVQSVHVGVEAGHYSWIRDAWQHLQLRFPKLIPADSDFGAMVHRYTEQAAAYVASRLGIVLQHTAVFLFHLAVTVVTMFYLYRDGDKIVKTLRESLPFETEHRERIVQETRDLIFASVTSSLAAAAAHGFLGGIAFALVGMQAPIFWGVMMGFGSFVPAVGSALVWVPIAVSLMMAGRLGAGIFLIVACGVIVVVVDNVIRPWLISGRAEMGALLTFISVLGGITVFGLLGVVLGPIVVAIGASLVEVYMPGSLGRHRRPKRGGKKKSAVLE